MRHTTWNTRAVSLLMSVVLLLGMIAPAGAVPAEHWSAQYLQKLVDWGVMREDQTNHPDRALTRAEFMAVINRAYGYTEMGENPFTDVTPEDWFYEDVCIAHEANYIHGTSETTASPNATLTRETAAFILGKNMMLKEVDGENLSFTDGRNVSSWSRGIVRAAVQNYLIAGYDDGSFRPERAVSVGEMAAMVTSCIGTPINKTGDYSLGGVFGNVTITASGVTLRDTTISGDLYITGGVGKGEVKLENVTVLGRIIDSGTGESQDGKVSVVMRNVIADELLVDNLKNDYVTLRTEGITQIGQVNVRTNAYLEDNTPQNYGMSLITVDGENGIGLDLAGRIKDVITKTPESVITAAKGTVQNLTVDEKAIDARVQVDRSAEVKTLNLDIGTEVNGTGDVATLNVNAPGSEVEMLPDQIVIRPGLTANINGQEMDTAAAEESSRDPKILSGYPLASDIAPTGLTALFETNKKGTVYWAVSAITDGSVDAEELINHSTYGSIAAQYGKVSVSGADVLVKAQIKSLTVGGSYYLSAVLVDDRGQQSPVKVTSFTTPDNTKPAFASGYPYMSLITDTDAQVTVMPTKSCKLYYALLPKGSTTPTVSEFKSYSVSGQLGFGVRDVIKNTEDTFTVNDKLLEEEVSYDLYLWLTDADGANSSNIQKVNFTTVDKTPPRFVMEPTVNKVQATSVGLTFTLNEAGTVYWVVVDEGASYPKPKPGLSEIKPDDDYAILQVASGLNALKSGKVNATANKEGTINVTGLTAEKAYDLWYVAQDKAGNYSVEVKKLTIHTLDEAAPVVTQYFTKYSGTDKTKNPMPDADIVLEFSEGVRSAVDGGVFLDLYEAIKDAEDKKAAKEKLGAALENSITMYQNEGTAVPTILPGRSDSTVGDDWVIDYRNAVVTAENGKVLVTFPTSDDPAESALNLASGATYYFKLKDITDTSNNQNPIIPNPVDYTSAAEGGHTLDQFTTVFAQVHLSPQSIATDVLPMQHDDATQKVRVDMNFRMTPLSTSKVGDNYSYDVLLWSDTIVEYDLYYRVIDSKGNPKDDSGSFYTANSLPNQSGTPDANGWIYLGSSEEVNPEEGGLAGKSLNRDFNHCGSSEFPMLNTLREDLCYEFIISIDKLVDSVNYDSWSAEVQFYINVAAGASERLETLGKNLGTIAEWERFIEDGLASQGGTTGGVSVGTTATSEDTLRLRQKFTNNTPPEFANGAPSFVPGDTFVTMTLNLDRKGEVYYVIAPAYGTNGNPVVSTTVPDGVDDDKLDDVISWDNVPENGSSGIKQPDLILPDAQNVFKPPFKNELVKTGHVTYLGGDTDQEELVKDLQPKTDYYAYFVLKGSTAQKLSQVYIYKFTTTEVSKPKIELVRGSGSVDVTTSEESYLNYIIFTNTELGAISWLKEPLDKHKAAGVILPNAYDDETYTVIQAMIDEYKYTNVSSDTGNPTGAKIFDNTYDRYSIFDLYADDQTKQRAAILIRSGAGNANATAAGERETEADVMQTVDESADMEVGTTHYFLAVAYHQASEEIIGDTFKAVDNIVVPDKIPPKPIKITTGQVTQKANGSYYGNVTVEFDKTLYWYSGASHDEAKAVYATTDTPGTTDNWVPILEYLGGDAVAGGHITLLSNEKHESRTFTLKFSNLTTGGTITFFNYGNISSASGYSATSALSLVLKKEAVEAGLLGQLGNYELKFVGTWDGKEVESIGQEFEVTTTTTP